MAGQVILRDILDDIDHPGLRMDFVWMHGKPEDNLGSATIRMPVNPDPRARVWWDEDARFPYGLGEFFPVTYLWDVYLIYDMGTVIQLDGTPGEPAYYEHQLSGLPLDLRLDAGRFAQEIKSRLPDCVAPPSP